LSLTIESGIVRIPSSKRKEPAEIDFGEINRCRVFETCLVKGIGSDESALFNEERKTFKVGLDKMSVVCAGRLNLQQTL
jgi:hypothetical protein